MTTILMPLGCLDINLICNVISFNRKLSR